MIRVWTNSTAALGTGTGGRQGLSNVLHLECHSLWVQQRLRRKEFELLKVDGEVNPADLLTQNLESKNKLDQVVGLFNCRFRAGRAANAPCAAVQWQALLSGIGHLRPGNARRVASGLC